MFNNLAERFPKPAVSQFAAWNYLKKGESYRSMVAKVMNFVALCV